MTSSNVAQVVADKIEKESHDANAIAKRLKEERRSFTSKEIREFFPRHEKLWKNNRTNLIPEISIASQIIYGSPVTIGIYPESISQFEKRFKIDYKAAILLAEEGWIFPSIYMQNPKDWNGHSELLDLVKISEVNGIRVNKYLENRFPNFTYFKGLRTEESKILLEELKNRDPSAFRHLCSLLEASNDSAARVLGNRWAYIDCFSPSSSEVFHELLLAKKYPDALDYLGVVQHLTVAPISGSLGGELTWSQTAIEKLKNVLNSNLKNRSNLTLGVADWQFNSKKSHNDGFSDFLLKRITKSSNQSPLEFNTTEKILRLVKDEDFKKLKLELNESMRKISTKSLNEVTDHDLNDWIKITEEVNRNVNFFKKTGSIVTKTIGVSLSLGLISGWYGIGLGVAFSLINTPRIIDQTLFKLLRSNQHRFWSSLNQTESIADNRR